MEASDILIDYSQISIVRTNISWFIDQSIYYLTSWLIEQFITYHIQNQTPITKKCNKTSLNTFLISTGGEKNLKNQPISIYPL